MLADGKIQWDPTPVHNFDIDGALGDQETRNKSKAIDRAQDFLKELLSNGPVTSERVFETAGEHGFSKSTVNRAKEKMGIKPYREGGIAENGSWYWELPEAT